MIKEFLPAVEWLEQDYESREKSYRGWRHPSDSNPDGSPLHPERDRNVFRRGPYQLLDDNMCDETLWEVCEENTGQKCLHKEHQEKIRCWCLQGNPGAITGLEWTEEDENHWLTRHEYQGEPERYSKYLHSVHPYLWDHAYDDKPNDIDWWKDGKDDVPGGTDLAGNVDVVAL